jgi:hypothetical protein
MKCVTIRSVPGPGKIPSACSTKFHPGSVECIVVVTELFRTDGRVREFFLPSTAPDVNCSRAPRPQAGRARDWYWQAHRAGQLALPGTAA